MIGFIFMLIYTDEVNMFDVLERADVVFVGEKHDDLFAHEMELHILKELSKRRKVVLSLEMFEKDVQKVLDDYLEGRIDEEEFLSRSRPWQNYRTDYRPLIEFAKEHGIPVIASNIPRRIANDIAHGREVEEREYLPDTVFFDDEGYRKRFVKTMMEIGHLDDMKMVDRFYRAQCYKDAVMAESMLEYMERYPGYLIVSVNGNFHSDFGSGIPYQLRRRNKDLNIKIVSVRDKYIEGCADFIIKRGEK